MPSTVTATVLDGTDPDQVLAAVDAAAPGLRRRLGSAAGAALRGRPAAVRRYVAVYRELVAALLASVHEARPELVLRDDSGEYCVAYGRSCTRAPIDLLLSCAADAPFSPWVRDRGLGAGITLDLVARLRALLPAADPLPLPAKAALPAYGDDPDALLRFRRLVAEEQVAERSDLERIREVFGLSVTDLAGLFGVTRQAVGLWLAGDVPPGRRAKVATVAAIADVLAHRLKPARVPGIVRRPSPAYGGRTMLELIALDQHEWLLESVRRSFDYAATA